MTWPLRVPGVLGVASALILAACIEGGDPETTEELAPKRPCGEPYCDNTPMLGDYPVPELDESGEEFVGGLRIKSFRNAAGDLMDVEIHGVHMHGRRQDDGALFAGAMLEGAKLRVESNVPEGPEYEIVFVEPVAVKFYKAPGNVPGWRLRYRVWPDAGPESALMDLCPKPMDTPIDQGMVTRGSIFYQLDRYDHDTAEVIGIDADALPYFNITCQDDARWKLVLMRLASAVQDASHASDEKARQAGLKSIIGDFCGDGYSWTRPNTPVEWGNAWLPFNAANQIEAIWDETGAVCFSTPRYMQPTCEHRELEPCTSSQKGQWWKHGTMITVLP